MNNNKSEYYMPPEWSRHRGTLIAWPSNAETWEGIEKEIRDSAAQLGALISNAEEVFISVKPSDSKSEIESLLGKHGANHKNIKLLDVPNNDSWTRDYGPNYVCREKGDKLEYAINNWAYNAWGGKYPPWDDDLKFKARFAESIGCKKIIQPEMILEGGSIDVNGDGVVLTTKSCLLNKNRNPRLNTNEIELRLRKFLGVHDIIWLGEGIAGDDTDGHIDDFVRFVKNDVIVCCFEEDQSDENHVPLSEAYNTLCSHEVVRENKIRIVKLPMPSPKYFRDFRVPASYANFYFINGAMIVPTFDDPNDLKAMKVFAGLRPDLKITGIPGINFVRGLGGVHCLTQQIY